jgi:hypothetical protein
LLADEAKRRDCITLLRAARPARNAEGYRCGKDPNKREQDAATNVKAFASVYIKAQGGKTSRGLGFM